MLSDKDIQLRVKTKQILANAFEALVYMPHVTSHLTKDNIQNTPVRAACAIMDDLLEGCWQDPKQILSAQFSSDGYDEIVYVNEITFVSVCCHHFLPFFGKAFFGYLPDKSVVGISKIPRLVHCYSRRPQLQEKLTVEIVDKFMEEVNPKGCGVVMEANHLCMAIRGVEEPAYTKTTALRGSFIDGHTKQEFLDGIRKISERIWP